jgi:hypothetical protein
LAEKFLVCLVKVASEFDMGIEGVWFAMEICFWVVWDTLCEVC